MICALLLAAGAGTRFGGPKLLTAMVGGRSLAESSAATLCDVLPRVCAVVRPGDTALVRRLRRMGVELAVNPDPDRGLGSSIAAGVAATADADGWLVALADMPWVRAGSVRAVADALGRGAAIAAPCYRGRRGHPVGFAAALRPALLALDGPDGARVLLRRGDVVAVPVDDPGVLADVDTPADLARGPDTLDRSQ